MREPPTRNSGFTLVELTMVLILIGIVSALGVGLFASKSGFSAFLARESLISAALLAQKQALANGREDLPVTLTIRQTPADWIFHVTQGSQAYDPQAAERADAELRVGGALLADNAQRTISYNANGSIGDNLQLRFDDANLYPVCIASTGFAYSGNCQP